MSVPAYTVNSMSTLEHETTDAGQSPPIRIMLVDDDAMVRTGVRAILEQSDRLRVVAEAADGDEVLSTVFAHRPDVVFMDLQMKRINGIDAIRSLQAAPNPPKIIALTSFDLDKYVFQALEAGAVGFLLKDSTAEELIGAVDIVMAGHSILSPRSTAHLVAHFARSSAATERAAAANACAFLTGREREVATLVSGGLTNQDIAERLYCSGATVKTHLAKVMAKLDAGSRVQVALTVQKAGLV